MNDIFRQAASMVLLRPETDGSYSLLLLHKPRKRDAWQLPQGGIEEGETLAEAAVRELHEEAGISDVQVHGQSALVYEYRFPPSYRRFRPDHICGQQIGFVFALCPLDTAVVVDNKEVDKCMWVKPGEIPKFVKRKEYLHLVQKLVEEAFTLI